MTASYGQLNIPGENKSDILIKYADTDYEICFSKKLIESTFDKYTGDILTLEEVLFYAREKNIICAYLGKDLAGILRFEIKNNLVWLQHIAVATQFRGNGIANALVKRYILDNRKHPETRYQLWVLTDNSKARTLYSKFGFIYGSKSSTSMLKD